MIYDKYKYMDKTVEHLYEEIANLKKEVHDLLEFKQVMINMNQLEDIEKHKCVCGSPASYWKLSCYGRCDYVCMKYPNCLPVPTRIFYVHPPKEEILPDIIDIDTDVSVLYQEDTQ